MWKRPELNKEKEKIFMCLSDAKQSTFEPNINKSVICYIIIYYQSKSINFTFNLKFDKIFN